MKQAKPTNFTYFHGKAYAKALMEVSLHFSSLDLSELLNKSYSICTPQHAFWAQKGRSMVHLMCK